MNRIDRKKLERLIEEKLAEWRRSGELAEADPKVVPFPLARANPNHPEVRKERETTVRYAIAGLKKLGYRIDGDEEEFVSRVLMALSQPQKS